MKVIDIYEVEKEKIELKNVDDKKVYACTMKDEKGEIKDNYQYTFDSQVFGNLIKKYNDFLTTNYDTIKNRLDILNLFKIMTFCLMPVLLSFGIVIPLSYTSLSQYAGLGNKLIFGFSLINSGLSYVVYHKNKDKINHSFRITQKKEQLKEIEKKINYCKELQKQYVKFQTEAKKEEENRKIEMEKSKRAELEKNKEDSRNKKLEQLKEQTYEYYKNLPYEKKLEIRKMAESSPKTTFQESKSRKKFQPDMPLYLMKRQNQIEEEREMEAIKEIYLREFALNDESLIMPKIEKKEDAVLADEEVKPINQDKDITNNSAGEELKGNEFNAYIDEDLLLYDKLSYEEKVELKKYAEMLIYSKRAMSNVVIDYSDPNFSVFHTGNTREEIRRENLLEFALNDLDVELPPRNEEVDIDVSRIISKGNDLQIENQEENIEVKGGKR